MTIYIEKDRFPISKIFLVSIYLLVPGIVWLLSTGNLQNYFAMQVPSGQFVYILSKLFGLYAIALLWLQLVPTLLSPHFHILPNVFYRYHRCIGSLSFIFLILHVITFGIAVFVRSGDLNLGLLVPHFSSGFYRQMVSLGAIAFWGFVLVFIAGICRAFSHKRKPLKNIWAILHKLSHASFLLVFIHSLAIGTESRQVLMIGFYWLYGLTYLLVVAGLLLVKMNIRSLNDDNRIPQVSR